MDLGFGQNGGSQIGAEAEELKPEALKAHSENAFELVQWINLEKTDGGTHAQLPSATSDAGVQLCPGRRFVGARSIRPPSDKVRHRPQWATASGAAARRWRWRASEYARTRKVAIN